MDQATPSSARPAVDGPTPTPSTTAELIEQVRRGAFGPPPSTMVVTYAFTTMSKSRHVGWANTYANYAVQFRVGRTVGACLFEPGSVSQETVEACVTRSVEELLDHPDRPVRIAALDAYLGELFPHHESPSARPYELPSGSSADKLRVRAAGVLGLLDPQPGQYVVMIGVIGTMIEGLRARGVRYALCDFDPQPPLSGDAVTPSMDAVLPGADGILASGMTISNDGFDTLLEHARRERVPLVVYSQSGSHAIPRFLGNGVTAVSAEPYPFFWAHGAPSTVYHYHARHLPARHPADGESRR